MPTLRSSSAAAELDFRFTAKIFRAIQPFDFEMKLLSPERLHASPFIEGTTRSPK
jgi:hypothetical protein